MVRAKLPREPVLDAAGRLQPGLAAWLRKALSPDAGGLLGLITAAAERQGLSIYLVGGFVRDLLLARPSLDLDLVLEGDAIRFARKLTAEYGGRLEVHPSFGTAVWHLPEDKRKLLGGLGREAGRPARGLPGHIDFISARRESYPRPAALPVVELADLPADQARRDFSINTLALRLDGELAGQLLDPWGGVADLRRGLLRTLHPRSFSDDPTRMLRALRFAGRLGFRLALQTRRELRAQRGGLSRVSGERIYNELQLSLQEEKRAEILAAVQRAGLLAAIHPRLRLPARAAAALADPAGRARPAAYWAQAPDALAHLGFLLWLMYLPPDATSALAERLRFEGDLRAAARGAAALRAARGRLAALRPSALVARLDKEPLLAVYAFYLSERETPLGSKLKAYARKWRHTAAHTDGDTLRRRGLPPGPAYARILARLRAAWLDGEVRRPSQEAALLEELLKNERA